MVATTKVTVSKSWSKVSDGDCTMQSVNPSNSYHVAVGANAPTTDAYLTLPLFEPTTLAYKTPVWCKLSLSSLLKDNAVLNIIK